MVELFKSSIFAQNSNKVIQFTKINKINNRFCYRIEQQETFNNILNWAQKLPLFSYHNSNQYYSRTKGDFFYNQYEFILAFSIDNSLNNNILNTSHLNNQLNNNNDWLFGYFSYDLKNEFHNLESNNIDFLDFNKLFFFSPDIVIFKQKNRIILESKKKLNISDFIKNITPSEISKTSSKPEIQNIKARYTKEEYINTVKKIKDHIQKGDIYELNFCQEFYKSDCDINPWRSFTELIKVSPTPFSVFFKESNKYLISASPERYICKIDQKIISQPIKGTIRRGYDKDEDTQLIQELRNNTKETAENVMIVDLVRNDLSQTAKKGSIKVEELFGIYPFKQLHQMISTISSELDEEKSTLDIIKTSFPMGSMTGAPKHSAMKLIEKYEKTKRGLYSGSVGYFAPNGNFDFNVVIRSILYNKEKRYLSFTVGSAITIQSEPEQEYEECLLKAKAINEIL